MSQVECIEMGCSGCNGLYIYTIDEWNKLTDNGKKEWVCICPKFNPTPPGKHKFMECTENNHHRYYSFNDSTCRLCIEEAELQSINSRATIGVNNKFPFLTVDGQEFKLKTSDEPSLQKSLPTLEDLMQTAADRQEQLRQEEVDRQKTLILQNEKIISLLDKANMDRIPNDLEDK